MMVKKIRKFVTLPYLLVFLFLAGCGGGGGGSSSEESGGDTTSVTIAFSAPALPLSSLVSSASIGTAAVQIPSGVASILVEITAPAISNFTTTPPTPDVFDISQNETVTKKYEMESEDGVNFYVAVYNAPNGTGTLLWEGNKTENLTGGDITVTIVMEPQTLVPEAVDVSDTTDEDTPVTTDVLADVLTNGDLGNTPTTITLVTQGSNGSVTITDSNTTTTYTPNPDFNGTDSYTYTITDNDNESSTATVTITVTPVNDAPVALDDLLYIVNENNTLVVDVASGVLANDTDVDGDALTANLTSSANNNGLLTLIANGSFTYVPNTGFNGPVSFTYIANDGSLDSNAATITITVNPVGNSVPVAVNDSFYSVDEDNTLAVDAASGVLANDTDADGDPLTANLASNVNNGALTLISNGSFTYEPVANSNGTDTFTYTANDGSVDSNVATATITVNPINDAPVALDDLLYTVNENNTLIIDAASGVLANDTDVDGDALTANLTSSANNNGLLTLIANGSFTYAPAAGFNGSVSFTYIANDGSLDSNTATLTITVNPVNDAPVANAGPDQPNVQTGQLVNLDGSGSSDPDSGPAPLTFLWSFFTVPASSGLTNTDITNPNTDSASFTPDVDGVYELNLEVSDSDLTHSDPVTITATTIIICDPPDLSAALAVLSAGDILLARDLFKDCSDVYDLTPPVDPNDADTAKFFYAMTRVFGLWYDMESDGDPTNGLNTVGDILDAFGCNPTGRNPTNSNYNVLCPALPLDSPTSDDILNFINTIVVPELQAAIFNLDAVSNTFDVAWTEPFSSIAANVESDKGDALVLRALINGLLAQINIMNVYNLSIDIDEEHNDNLANTNSAQEFLADNLNFLTLINAGFLTTAKSLIVTTLDDMDAAITAIENEVDDQTNDWITLLPAEIPSIRNNITTTRLCLDGPCFAHHNSTPSDTSDDSIIDLSPFFNPGIDLRALLPSYQLDDPFGFFPDNTFGGILVRLEDGEAPSVLDTNRDSDLTADIFEKDIYYVYGGNNISGGAPAIDDDPEAFGFVFLGAANAASGAVVFTDTVTYPYYLIKPSKYQDDELFDTEIYIDAFEFLDSTGNWWFLPWWVNFGFGGNLTGAPDSVGAILDNGSYILMTAPAGTTGITVYGLPVP